MMKTNPSSSSSSSRGLLHVLSLTFLIGFCFIQFYTILHGENCKIGNRGLQQQQQYEDHHHSSPPACTSNPYLNALEPLSNITMKMDQWLDNYNALGTKSLQGYVNVNVCFSLSH